MQNKINSLSSRLPGPENIERFQLSNGITVLSFSNMSSKSLTIIGFLASGGFLDEPDKLGKALFTASMLLRGNQKDDFHAIHNKLETVGARLSFNAGTLNTWFNGRALVKDFPMLLAMIKDSLLNPTFPEIYIARLRKQLLTALLIRDQDTREKASLEFDKLIFPNHPYGTPVDGYPETLQNIQRSDLIQHHQTYHPQNAIFAVAGALPAETMRAMLEDEFSTWSPANTPIKANYPKIKPPREESRLHFPINGKSQNDVVMGTIGPSRQSPDYYSAYLGNHILGQFGLYGRIGQSVRNRAGLAYYAYSSLNALPDTGSWTFQAGVNPNNVSQTIELIKKEITHYLSEPVKEEELADSQSHLIGRLPMSLESNAGIASVLLSIERYQLGLDYLQRYAHIMKTITPEMILEASRRYLDPEKLVIISAGAQEK